MTLDEAKEELARVFPDKILINKKELAQISGRSQASINRDIAKSIGVEYKIVGGRILFPVINVAKWMCGNNIKTV